MNTAYFYLTDEGGKLAHKLAAAHPGDIYNKENFKENLRAGFGRYDSLVCIMATGIVVRILAPLIVHKTSDPDVYKRQGEFTPPGIKSSAILYNSSDFTVFNTFSSLFKK